MTETNQIKVILVLKSVDPQIAFRNTRSGQDKKTRMWFLDSWNQNRMNCLVGKYFDKNL